MIKRFNELFDSEEMKDYVLSQDPSAEIDYLAKNYSKYAKVDYKFGIESIDNLLMKVINFHHPFMKAFLDANETEEGKLEFSDFDLLIRYDDTENYQAFILASERFMLVLGIRVVGEKFDVYLLLDDAEDEDKILSFEEKNITFNEVVNIISQEYISAIKEYGFSELLNYFSIRNQEAYN